MSALLLTKLTHACADGTHFNLMFSICFESWILLCNDALQTKQIEQTCRVLLSHIAKQRLDSLSLFFVKFPRFPPA